LVLRPNGEVLFEDYPNAGGADKAWELASGTKSFTGVIAAAAVADGLLRLDEPAAETIAEWRQDRVKSRITIHQLLSLESGLRAGAIGRPPTYADAINTESEYEPGSHFEYGPAPFQIFGEIMRRKLKRDRDPVAYLERRVLSNIAVAPQFWRQGSDGMPFMPQGAGLTARDWAKFGRFVWDGGRGLVDAGALAQCFQPSNANPGYGMSWWLLRPGLIPPVRGAGVSVDAREAGALGETAMAAGAGDQRLYLLRDKNLIVVRQANQIIRGMFARGDQRWSDETFLRLLLGLSA
jgi:CubicO group peptidase (beta-lactamase class C family)